MHGFNPASIKMKTYKFVFSGQIKTMKVKTLFNDRYTLWIIFGIAGSICREIIDSIFLWAHISNGHIVYLAADLFSNNLGQIRSLYGIIAGTLTDWVLGAIIGIVIGLIFQWTGHRNYLLKGIGVGLLAWIGIYGFLVHGMPQMFVLESQPMAITCLSIIVHCIFGGVTAFLINKFVPTKSQQWHD
jgi:hypothetical protein